MSCRQPAVWFPAIRCGTGTDIFTERLVEGLRARGIRAEISWLPHRAEYVPLSVPILKAPAWANVIHINSWLPTRFVPNGLPLVVTVHHSVHHHQARAFKSILQRLYHDYWVLPIEKRQIRQAHAVVAVSRHVADEISRISGREEVQVIPNGIDVEKAFFPGKERTDPHEPFRLLYVGNWIARKGVDLLGPIMEILGEGFELCYTADRSGAHEKCALPANAMCLGRLSGEALVQAYRDADAFLFPSRSEGMPLTVIEAMACGLPTIASDIAPLREVVQNEITGYLCPENDAAAFAQAVRSLAGDFDVWSKMRRASRERAETTFSLSHMTRSYLSIYEGLVI